MIFEDLFVLEVANNHWGNVGRGLQIISEFSKIAKQNNVKTAIKLQFRDVDNFIHKDFRNSTERYIKKTIDTKMSYNDYVTLVKAIEDSGCITMATPFDEKSVQMCVDLGIEIIKIASSDINDWSLIEEIAKTKKPVIVSTGGASLKEIDIAVVNLFKNIPFAINHCVALYPSEKHELELNQIDVLKNRYPHNTIGYSTHERNEDIEHSIMIAYAKGARTFERHIDIDQDGIPVSPYCSLPKHIDRCMKALNSAKLMCGSSQNKVISERERVYLNNLLRGIYLKNDLPEGHILTKDDIYLAIPLQKGQLSCNDLVFGKRIIKETNKEEPLMKDYIN